MKRMTPPFRIRMILVETNIKINNDNNKFIYFVFPTSDEDIRMSTPVFLFTQAKLFSPNNISWEGLKCIFTSLNPCAVCCEMFPVEDLRGKYVVDFLSLADLLQISPGFSVHILGDLQSDFPSDKIILST